MASKAIQCLNSGNNCWASIWNEWKESYEWKEGEYKYGVSFSDSCPIPLLVQSFLTVFNIIWMQWNMFDQIHLFYIWHNNLSPYLSALDFYNSWVWNNSSLMNLIFSLFQTWILQATAGKKFQFKLGKNPVHQT